MKTRFNHWSMILLLLVLGLPACQPASNNAAPLTPVSVQLSFTHQAEFAGFYAAAQQGFYEEEGLDVTFLEGGPEVDFIAPVANGTAEFGVAQPADLILARAAGMPVRAIAVIYRRSPIVFFSLADSGITRPQDFVGKRIRSTTTIDRTLRAMMSRLDIAPDQYEIVYLPSNVAQFASGQVPVWGGLMNLFALEVQQAGHTINIIYPDDYGIHFYANTLITTDELIAADPDLVLRFTRATLNGWTYVVENPEAVGKFVQEYNPNADPQLEIEKMTASIPLVNTGEDFIGWMKPEVWAHIEQTLREQNVLTGLLRVEDVYTLQFLEEIYGQ
ncbi:MAG TPA: ABC transporter substrate-binding protein [Anaerolineales bacterium]|nr:ABC transporter substrate-binding protein [Anaerolineales bacterium]